MYAIYRRYRLKSTGREFDMYVARNGLTCNGASKPKSIKKYNTYKEAEKELNYLNKIRRTGWKIVEVMQANKEVSCKDEIEKQLKLNIAW